MVREIRSSELRELLTLYLDLHETSVPEESEGLLRAWEKILADPNHHIIVSEADGQLVSSCVCVIVPNLTRNARPYALIENVVTRQGYRGRGLASECLAYAKELAVRENCYKMMLLTGSKEEATLAFYRKAGYSSSEKTAFYQRLP